MRFPLVVFSVMAALTHSAFAESPCETLHDEASATVRRCEGVSVVRLSGAPIARAKKMGELLRGPLSPDVVNYFSHKVTSLAEQEAGFAGRLAGLAYNQVVRLLHRAMPTKLAEEVNAMAQGMGIDPIVIRRGLSLPDTGVLLQGLGSLPLLEFLPAAGCSSVAVRSKAGFLWGRNLDFAGVGTFDRHPMLLSIEPEPGSGELRHLVAGADGLLYGGITGVNEAGIAFAIHQNFSRDVGVYGVPMIMIGELVLRHAHNLDEAEEILRRHRPASIWTFVVADLNRREMMAVESSQRHFLPRRMEGNTFVQTNHNMHEESREWENGDTGVIGNSAHRMKKAFEIVENEKSPGLETVARVLSYQENSHGYFSSYHDILKSETIQSVIFDATGQWTLYLSADEAPSSGGKYATFPLKAFFEPGARPEPGLIDLVRTPAEKRVRQREIAQAYHAYFDLRRPLDAAAILEGHPTLNSHLFRALAFYKEGKYQEALAIAESGQRNPRFLAEPAYIHESLATLRLASFLRMGRKEEARQVADLLLAKSLVKGITRRLATLVAAGKAPPAWMLNFNFNFFSGDLGGRKDRIEQR